MRFRVVRIFQGLALGAAVLCVDSATAPASAQDDPPALSVLIELAQNGAADDILSVPGAQLAGVLAGGTAAERLALVGVLPASAVDAMLVLMLQADAADDVIVDVVEAVIVNDPQDTARVIDVVRANTGEDAGPALAAVLVGRIEGILGDAALAAPDQVLQGLVLVALSLDAQVSATNLVALGGRLSADAAEALATALVQISASTEEFAVASAIDTAVALGDGQFGQVFRDAREEIGDGAVPAVVLMPAPDSPLIPPAELDTSAVSPGDAPATTAGEGATTAQAPGGSGETPLAGAPSERRSGEDEDEEDEEDDSGGDDEQDEPTMPGLPDPPMSPT